MIFRCKGCRGAGMVRQQLTHPWAIKDDDTYVRHQPCEGTGYLERAAGFVLAYHGYEQHLACSGRREDFLK